MTYPEVGQNLLFPDGDIAVITKLKEYKDEEDSVGLYDCLVVTFTIVGDETQQEFTENLDSREDYRFNVMKPIDFDELGNILDKLK